MKALLSKAPGQLGCCKPAWPDTNQVCNCLDGGMTGFFKNVHSVWRRLAPVRYGNEFHGVIRAGAMVYPTMEQDK